MLKHTGMTILAMAAGCWLAVSSAHAETPATEPAASAPAAFVHPGTLHSAAELAKLRERLNRGEEPWKSMLAKMQASKVAALTYAPHPREVVDVGFFNKPDNGGTDELRDATAAYTHALLFSFTGDEAHAKKAAEILDAWTILQTHTGDNAKVQASWSGSVFPVAADLLHATYPGWPAEKVSAFSAMLDRAFVPLIENGMPTYNGNWELSMCSALMAIGVNNDNPATFKKGVFLLRQRVPAYIYLRTDGDMPVKPYNTEMAGEKLLKHWHNPGKFVDGLCQETGRDFPHLELGLAAISYCCEIGYHQGMDLYAEVQPRLTATMEFHAGYRLGDPIPADLCGGTLKIEKCLPTYEIAYNHFHNRRQIDLPRTRQLIDQQARPRGVNGPVMFIAWESLTHGELDAMPGK